jgi:hypothetical protein
MAGGARERLSDFAFFGLAHKLHLTDSKETLKSEGSYDKTTTLDQRRMGRQ